MGGRDFDTDFLAILEKLRAPELNGPSLRAEIQALRPPEPLTEAHVAHYFTMIYDNFHADVDQIPPSLQEARANEIREFYKLIAYKLLKGKPQAMKEIPIGIYKSKKAEKLQKQKNQKEEQEKIAIQQLMTDFLVDAVLVIEGGRRKKTRSKRSRYQKSRRSRK